MQNLIREIYTEDPNLDAERFFNLAKEAESPLYPSTGTFSNLSFIVKLMHIKCINGWSDKSFNMLLELLTYTFPLCEKLPVSNYQAKKIVKDLGLHYEKIDACKNDCMIYYKELVNASHCPTCKVSRWKVNNGKGKKIPWKVMRYFPLTPRLQRLFMSSKTTTDMRWHSVKRVNDGILRHLVDGEDWKCFDNIHESFASDPRNVRLGLATSGFNSFGNMNLSYSVWPVVLFPYNLPPWMCMKDSYMFMSLLIPGPKGPGNDIHIYLQPLIDELKELWEVGACTYDILTKQNFQMRAAVLWTVNDFPAYGNL